MYLMEDKGRMEIGCGCRKVMYETMMETAPSTISSAQHALSSSRNQLTAVAAWGTHKSSVLNRQVKILSLIQNRNTAKMSETAARVILKLRKQREGNQPSFCELALVEITRTH